MVLTLSAAQLTTRLSRPAREIAARLGQIGARASRAAPDRAAPDRSAETGAAAALPVGQRLHVRMLRTAPEADACASHVAAHAALAEAERWADLLHAIREADQTRAAAPGGLRLATLASQGARHALTQAIARADWTAAEAEVDRLTAVAAAHPDDYVAAHLLAQAHLDLGWARRGAAADRDTGRERWQGFLSHTAEADRIIEAFDPILENSALLAATRYHLVRGLEDAQHLFRDWYEDWADLDPTSPEPHAAHAVHLLPDWYGTFPEFDAAAREAVGRSAHVSGHAAYAVYYMSAADTLGDTPAIMDLGLYLRGLTDFQRATGCQSRANIVAGALTELLHAYSIDAAPGSMRARMVHEVLDDLLREVLREFHLSAWENGEACIHWALEQVFRTELAEGAHIHVGPAGLEARLPV